MAGDRAFVTLLTTDSWVIAVEAPARELCGDELNMIMEHGTGISHRSTRNVGPLAPGAWLLERLPLSRSTHRAHVLPR